MLGMGISSKAILVTIFLFGQLGSASECDNFSGRSIKKVYGNEKINFHVNEILKSIVREANQSVQSKDDSRQELNTCDRGVLLHYFENKFGGNFPDIYGRFIWDSPPIAGPREFKDFPFKDKYLNSFAPTFVPSYWIHSSDEDFMIGMDKIDHFFSHGYHYWRFAQRTGKPLKAALTDVLKFGEDQENSIWGLRGFGIKSYGDLSANYLGMTFWMNLLDGDQPHVICQAGQFELAREFRVTDYFNAAVDEGINCSSFSSKEIKDQMTAVEAKVWHQCGLPEDHCSRLVGKFPFEVAQKILHPICLGQASSRIEEPPPLSVQDFLNAAIALTSGGENLIAFFFDTEKIKSKFEQTKVEIVETLDRIKNFKR